jgi:hypothetical protein
MKFARDHHPDKFTGCEPSIKFIERIADLIHAFNSRSSKGALRKPSPEREVIFFSIVVQPHLVGYEFVRNILIIIYFKLKLFYLRIQKFWVFLSWIKFGFLDVYSSVF